MLYTYMFGELMSKDVACQELIFFLVIKIAKFFTSAITNANAVALQLNFRFYFINGLKKWLHFIYMSSFQMP